MAPATDTTISQLRRGVLEFCVLALLQDGERYSFEIVSALGEIEGLVTSEGTLYPLLGRLRREGLLESTLRESQAGPPRRYYTTTPDGDAVLRAFTLQWTRFRDSVDSLLEGAAARTDRRGSLPGSPGSCRARLPGRRHSLMPAMTPA